MSRLKMSEDSEIGKTLALIGMAMLANAKEQPVSEESRRIAELLMKYNMEMFEQIVENLERQMKESHNGN